MDRGQLLFAKGIRHLPGLQGAKSVFLGPPASHSGHPPGARVSRTGETEGAAGHRDAT